MSKKLITVTWTVAASGLLAPLHAANLKAEITLPEIETASYYKPYLAAWIEGADQSNMGTLAVWYDTKLRDNLGRGWLRDLRTWWRKGGQDFSLPADGISGATKAPGTHVLSFADNSTILASLPAGSYHFAVEVARENGGRELVKVPFEWNGKQSAAQQTSAQGKSELGSVALSITP